jgi:dTDP-4-dehydrorhamnose reductase
MRLLVTGKDGQVGFELLRSLAPLGEVVGLSRQELDLTDPDAIRRVIRDTKPSIVINPAAYTAVDKAESDQALATKVNAVAPGLLGEEAKRLGALVVHYSTDYVFDGTKPSPYVETDSPNPQSVYGRTKWQGEEALAQSTPKHLILRTSWVLGRHGNNFAKTMLRLAAEREELKVVADQFGAPTSAALLARVTAALIAAYAQGSRDFAFGTYHAVALGETHWCDYARFVMAEAKALGKALRTSPESVHPIATTDYPTPAKRPQNSRLSTEKLTQSFGLTLPPWQDGVREVLAQIL